MKVETIKVGEYQTNCYLLVKDNKVLIVDPGDDYLLINENIKDRMVLAILITHHHFDHVGALEELVNKYQVNVYDFENTKEQAYEVGNFKFSVINTPGHTADSITFYFLDDKKMFVGDFIFKNDIGRCDLPTGNYEIMLHSIKKIKNYDKDIIIYPGHEEKTSLQEENLHNYYFKVVD